MTDSLKGLAPSGPRLTHDLVYQRGQYSIGEASLPYFSVSLPVEDAVRILKLARDVIFEPQEPIRLDELFQREVDQDRVSSEIVPYLARTHHLKFFNAITVVLLPVNPSKRVVLDQYPDSNPALEGEGSVVVGGIQLRPLAGNDTIGHIKWSMDEVYPVIVDGQHRFSALKAAYDDTSFPWRPGLRETQIPVLLILPSEKVGYKTTGDPLTVLQACRSVFIDLNKHAAVVPAARRYLLDDQDLVAVSMRQMLSDGTAGRTIGSPVIERIADQQRLPLALVNWSQGLARFDNDEFLSSVPTIYDLVRVTLGKDVVQSNLNVDESRKAVDSMRSRLNLSDDLTLQLMQSIATAEAEQIPFELSQEQYVAIAGEVRSGRGIFVWGTLARFAPYANLIEAYERAGFLNGVHENWMALDAPGRKAVEAAVAEGEPSPAKLIQAVYLQHKSDSPLAFQVVFQKVLVRCVNNLYSTRTVLASVWGVAGLADANFATFHDEWIMRVNDLFASQVGPRYKNEVSVWDGTILSSAKSLQITEAAQAAGEALIAYALLAPINDWVRSDERKAIAWVKNAWKAVKRGKATSPTNTLYQAFGTPLKRSMQHVVIARYRANDQDPPAGEQLDNEAAKVLAQRLLLLTKMPPAAVRSDV